MLKVLAKKSSYSNAPYESQKVIAQKKWGVIPMSRKNAVKVRDILNNSNFEKAELLALLKDGLKETTAKSFRS
ncbi:hypothetical protein ACT7C3_10070 [Bacillus pacificus]